MLPGFLNLLTGNAQMQPMDENEPEGCFATDMLLRTRRQVGYMYRGDSSSRFPDSA